MTNLPMVIVDVFTQTRYAGNQLAVFRHAEALSDEEMLKIAQEMNYSETTFIRSDEPTDGGYDVRIFTTVSELPFAGHPTLGTAYVIQQEILGEPEAEVILNLKVGQIPVTVQDEGVLWMQQKSPSFGHEFGAATIAAMLGLEPDEIDSRFPVQSASTGLAFIIVPLTSLHAVRRAKVNLERFKTLIDSVDDPLKADALLVFSPETYHKENQLNARVFVDFHGAPEDPATGSANGALAGYLVKHQYFGTPEIDCRVEQGYEINRPSLLMLRARPVGDDIEVRVGGHVVMVAKGELLR